MEKIILDCCRRGRPGFMPLAMPTGYGKTRAAKLAMAELLRSGYTSEHPVYFVTTQKNNLPYEEFLEENDFSEGERSKVIRIYSNFDSVVDSLGDVYDLVKAVMKGSRELDSLRSSVEAYNSICRRQSDCINDGRFPEAEHLEIQKKALGDDIRESKEPAFRRALKRAYAEASCHGSEWDFIDELYPDSQIEGKEIFFMTMAKFLGLVDPIRKGSFSFSDASHMSGAILIIDEIDSTKATVLEHIIEAGRHTVDTVLVFKHIMDRLKDFDNFKEPYLNKKPDKNPHLSVGARYERLFSDGKKIVKKYAVDQNLILEREDADKGRCLIVQDVSFNIIGGSTVDMEIDREIKRNVVKFGSKRPVSDEAPRRRNLLRDFQKDVNRFLDDFVKLAVAMANNRAHSLYGNNADSYMDEQTTVVLNDFDLIDTEFEMMKNLVNERLRRHKMRPDKGEKLHEDYSFYNKGLYLYDFDTLDPEIKTSMSLTRYSTTPEQILVSWAKRATAIGISATAFVETATGNYDMKYLRSNSNIEFLEVPQEDLERIDSDIAARNSCYDGSSFDVRLVESDSFPADKWEEVFSPDMASDIVSGRIRKLMPLDGKGNVSYDERRMFRIVWAFKQFYDEPGIQSMLAFMNRYPRSGDGSFDHNLMAELFRDYVLDREGWGADRISDAKKFVEEHTVVLNSVNFEKKKRLLRDALSRGKKLMVISVYRAIGAGQNLQYEMVAEDGDLGEVRTEKDFDAIYLDRPTNVSPPIVRGDEGRSRVRYLFYVEFLLQAREITRGQAMELINQAFNGRFGDDGRMIMRMGINGTPSIHSQAAVVVEQAIGRICRTRNKNKIIRIFADKSMSDIFDRPKEFYGRNRNLEFDALYEKLHKESYPGPVENILIDVGRTNCKNASIYIDGFLRSGWDLVHRSDWRDLREFVLKNPVADSVERGYVRDLYIPLPAEADSLRYKRSASAPGGYDFMYGGGSGPSVSADGARLPQLMRCDVVRAWFEEHGYATGFPMGRFVMCPAIFNQIYKGALGEAAGLAILESRGIHLSEMAPEDFERFDYRCGPSCLFDFKHWLDPTDLRAKEKGHIFDKMAIVAGDGSGDGAVSFIINVLKPSDRDISGKCTVFVSDDGRFRIVGVPYLYDPEKDSFNEEAIQTVYQIVSGTR